MHRIYRDVLTTNCSTTDQIRVLSDVVDDITVDDRLDLHGLRAILSTAALIGPEHIEFYDLNADLDTATTKDGDAVLVVDRDTGAIAVDRLLNAPEPASDAQPSPIETLTRSTLPRQHADRPRALLGPDCAEPDRG